jgi:hypothetical protein
MLAALRSWSIRMEGYGGRLSPLQPWAHKAPGAPVDAFGSGRAPWQPRVEITHRRRHRAAARAYRLTVSLPRTIFGRQNNPVAKVLFPLNRARIAAGPQWGS